VEDQAGEREGEGEEEGEGEGEGEGEEEGEGEGEPEKEPKGEPKEKRQLLPLLCLLVFVEQQGAEPREKWLKVLEEVIECFFFIFY